jgi:demethylspheroidene O-methyltransferase
MRLQPSAAVGLAAQPAHTSWLDRCVGLRDRLLASPRFQRWAVANPLTRPFARRRARALFDLCAGFVYSQVLLACVRLRLFEILAERPQTLAALSERLSLPIEAAARLLSAAVALQLVERRANDRYGLGVLGAALAGNPGVAAMIEHHALLYADLRDPVALLRGQCADIELAGYWAYAGAAQPAGLPAERVAAYSALMTASQPMIAGEILAAYSLQQYRCLLDVGGGEGAFLAAAAASAPNLQLKLFDLPAVVERAQHRLEAAGLSGRATVTGGNFFVDPLPRGADVVSLVRVIHDHNDDAVLALLRAVRRILPDDGVLLLAEPLSGTQGAEPVGDAYFGFYLLAMGRGRARSAAELMKLLGQAGFGQCRLVATRMPLQTSLIVARPAANWQP